MLPTESLPVVDPATSSRSVTLLLIEDNDGDALLLETHLTEAQAGTPLRPTARVHRTSRLHDALDLLAREPIEVVLLDLGLPDAEGLDAARAAAPHLPIVVLTGLDDDAVALEALRAGAQDYIVKDSASGDVLLRIIRYAMERKRAEDEAVRSRWLAGIGQTAIAVRHEVNNPLATLLLEAELLSESGRADPEVLETIIGAARRIAEVTGRLDRLGDPQVTAYMRDGRMLDLSGDDGS